MILTYSNIKINSGAGKSEGMRNLIRWQQELRIASLPPGILKNVMKGLVWAGATIINQQEKINYCDVIITPVQNKLKGFLQKENLQRIYHNEDVQKEFIDILELMTGIVLGVKRETVEIVMQVNK